MFAAPNTFFTAVGKLTTVTFTANGTWTAPGNVSLVTTISGKGSDGVSDSTTSGNVTFIQAFFSSDSTTPITGTWQDAIDFITPYVTTMNTGSGVSSIAIPATFGASGSGLRVNSSNFGTYGLTASYTETVNYVKGSASLNLFRWPPSGVSASSVPNYADVSSNWPEFITVDFTRYVYGNAGDPSTGLGQTFPGGAYVAPTGYPATTTTFNNVSVTPSTSYSIVVPSGGTVSISYYA